MPGEVGQKMASDRRGLVNWVRVNKVNSDVCPLKSSPESTE